MTRHLAHDLPDYVADPPKWRVQIWRGQQGWNWGHQCTSKTHAETRGCLTWRIAMHEACEHMREHG